MSEKTWKRGVKEIEVDWGIVFSMSCSGYNRTEIAKHLGFNHTPTLNNKLRSFRDVNRKDHIKFIIKCLKEELKK